MKTRKILLSAVAVTGSVILMSTSNPAEAKRKSCVYMAHNPNGSMIADGWAKAIKLSWACNRAERRCERELKRKFNQHKVGRGVSCRKITNLSD